MALGVSESWTLQNIGLFKGPTMCGLENPRKTSVSAKPDLKKIVGVGLGLSGSWKLENVGFFGCPWRVHFGKPLGKRESLQSQNSRNLGGWPRAYQETRAYWKGLGKRIFLQSQIQKNRSDFPISPTDMCTLENLGETSISAKPDSKEIIGVGGRWVLRKIWFFGSPSCIWKNPRKTSILKKPDFK